MNYHAPRAIKRKDGTGVDDAQDLATVQKKLETVMDTVKNFGEDVAKKMQTGQAVTDELKQLTDTSLTNMNEIKSRLDEMEQKAASRQGHSAPVLEKTAGQLLVETEAFKAASSTRSNVQFDVEVKAVITSDTADAAGAAGDLVAPQRVAGVQLLPGRRMTIRDLVTPGRMDSSNIEYVQETGFNNNAAMVAEGAAKPASDIKYDMKSESAKVIAHHMKASRQILDDASQLQSLIDYRLRYGLAYKEEEQLLLGDGTGQNLHGIIPQASAYAPAFAPAAESMLDKLRLSMLQSVLAEFPATGHVLNPIDWARLELTKDSEGRYVIGNPQSNGVNTLWGLPVVETQSMSVDKFLSGAFKMGAQIFDRWDTRVEVANTHGDDFTNNLVTILAEERLAFAVYRPEAFIYGDFGNVA